MEKIYYNKLCRDKVPAMIAEKGFECDVRVADHDEYKRDAGELVVVNPPTVKAPEQKSKVITDIDGPL